AASPVGASSSSTPKLLRPAAAARRSRSSRDPHASVRPPRDAAYQHVVFDLDGTLVDSRADLAASVNHVLNALNLAPLPPETLYGYIGEGARVLVERALGPRNAERAPEALARFLEHYSDHLLDRTVPYPGIADALGQLAEHGVTLSVLTNKPE